MIPTLLLLAVVPAAEPAGLRYNPLADGPAPSVAAAPRRFNPLAGDGIRPSAAMTKVAAAGWHVHRCANGHEWSHHESSLGNVAAHTCPACGLRDWTPRQTGTRIVPATSAAAAPTPPTVIRYGVTSHCPGGVCPVRR